ncbi:putative inactive heme oxygenase 2, chloroplastic [Bidens hawaiensis]|uniref:putative inactive heme oxygenase 2, chloroplastic n=1 Tax=Bidens hawaiensis TaxID=980011 RepID=UPI00404A4019
MSAPMMKIPTGFSLNYPYTFKTTRVSVPVISYCLNSTTELSSSSPPDNLLPPVKKKRKPYRRLRPGEAQGITEEMRFVAMKLREKKLKVETDELDEKEGNSDGDGDQTWEPELDGFVRYLVDSEFVFSTVERLIDESQDVSFAYFRNSGLERCKSFSKDIEWLSTQDFTIPEPLFTSKKYVKYLEELAAQSPPLFFCHLYNIYFSHIAGGQVIARKVSEKLLNGQELAICQWPGDPEELLKGMRDKLNALAEHWTRDEKNKCLKETSKCFMYMGTIIRLIIMR